MSLDVFVFADVNGKKDMVDRRGGAKVDTLAVRFCIHLFYLPLTSPFLSSPLFSSGRSSYSEIKSVLLLVRGGNFFRF